MTPESQKPEADALTAPTAVGSGDWLGGDFDSREFIFRGGKDSEHLNALLVVDDYNFEKSVFILRCCRSEIENTNPNHDGLHAISQSPIILFEAVNKFLLFLFLRLHFFSFKFYVALDKCFCLVKKAEHEIREPGRRHHCCGVNDRIPYLYRGALAFNLLRVKLMKITGCLRTNRRIRLVSYAIWFRKFVAACNGLHKSKRVDSRLTKRI